MGYSCQKACYTLYETAIYCANNRLYIMSYTTYIYNVLFQRLPDREVARTKEPSRSSTGSGSLTTATPPTLPLNLCFTVHTLVYCLPSQHAWSTSLHPTHLLHIFFCQFLRHSSYMSEPAHLIALPPHHHSKVHFLCSFCQSKSHTLPSFSLYP